MTKDAKHTPDVEMPLIRKHGSSSDDETQSQPQPNRENSGLDVHIEEKGLTLHLSWKKIAALVCAILVGLSSMGYIVKLT